MLPLLPVRSGRLVAPLLPILAVLPLAAQTTQRVSIDAHGSPSAKGSFFWPSISGDGSNVAFASASDLVAGDTNGAYDVYVHDRTMGALVLASVAEQGLQANDRSDYPAISAGGRYVAFESRASNLVPGDTNQLTDVFLRDLRVGVTVRVSVDSQGVQGNLVSSRPCVSADGTRVAFHSDAGNLVGGDGNGTVDVFVRDVVAGVTRRVSVSSAGVEGELQSDQARLSADGRFVAFESLAHNLVPGDTNSAWDVFVHELSTGATARVSVGSGGVQSDGWSIVDSISADGRYVSFTSAATNLVAGDGNGVSDVFVHDRQTGSTERVSVNSAGVEGAQESRESSLDGGGRLVTFASRSNKLAPNGLGNQFQIYLHDRLTGVTTRESVDAAGHPGQLESRDPLLSLDGSAIAFWSWAADLVSSDLNGVADTFVRDLEGCSPTIAGFCRASTTSIAGCQAHASVQGLPSMSSPASFTISAGPLPGGGSGLAVFGVQGAELAPLGTQGGLLCVGSRRFAAPLRSTGGSPGLCDGQLHYGLDEWIAAHPTAIGPGAVVHASFWFRDAKAPDGFGLSDGVWFQVCP